MLSDRGLIEKWGWALHEKARLCLRAGQKVTSATRTDTEKGQLFASSWLMNNITRSITLTLHWQKIREVISIRVIRTDIQDYLYWQRSLPKFVVVLSAVYFSATGISPVAVFSDSAVVQPVLPFTNKEKAFISICSPLTSHMAISQIMPIVYIDNGASVATWEVMTLTGALTEFHECRHKEHGELQDRMFGEFWCFVAGMPCQHITTDMHSQMIFCPAFFNTAGVSAVLRCRCKHVWREKRKQENVVLPYKEKEKFKRKAIKGQEWTKDDNLSCSPISVIICFVTYKTSCLTSLCVFVFFFTTPLLSSWQHEDRCFAWKNLNLLWAQYFSTLSTVIIYLHGRCSRLFRRFGKVESFRIFSSKQNVCVHFSHSSALARRSEACRWNKSRIIRRRLTLWRVCVIANVLRDQWSLNLF